MLGYFHNMAKYFIALSAVCVLAGLAVAAAQVNIPALKKKMVPTPTAARKHSFTFKLCGTPMFARITDVLEVADSFVSVSQTTASIWIKAGITEDKLQSDLRVYVDQETSSDGKITYKTPPKPENPHGVKLMPILERPSSCWSGINTVSPSDQERKVIADEVLKIANAA